MFIAKRVRELMKKTLAGENDESLKVEGLVNNFAFDVGKIDENKSAIEDLLQLMPENFRKDVGGGWSFLQLCVDNNGEQWGEHPDMEALVCLGIAADLAEYVLPRELWKALPGGVPYIAFNI